MFSTRHFVGSGAIVACCRMGWCGMRGWRDGCEGGREDAMYTDVMTIALEG